MSEIEDLYAKAGIYQKCCTANDCLDMSKCSNCHFNKIYAPPFTAKKQLELINEAIDKLQDFRTANRKAKIEDLRAQLAALEAEQFSADRIAELKEEPIELEPEEKWTDR